MRQGLAKVLPGAWIYQIQLRVGRIDGSGLRMIGQQPWSYGENGSIFLQWLPDGKHVFFKKEDAFYVVPVD